MRKALFFISGVLVIVILTDILFGVFSKKYVSQNTLPGDYRFIDYVIKECNEDIVILGSSIALNGLMPSVIEDSVKGMTCYNAGANGQNIVFYETMLDCILERYKPKYIVLGLRPDELTGNGIGGRYNLLSPYYGMGYNMIDSCMNSKDKYEKYLLKSNLYLYNTIWWRIFLYHFITPGEDGENGFVAKGIPMVYPTMIDDRGVADVTEERLRTFSNIIYKCKSNGIKLVVFFPPMYINIINKTTPTVNTVLEICKKNDIPCYYDTQDAYFLKNKELFYDNVHLNKNGALEYSNIMASRLKNIIPSAQ